MTSFPQKLKDPRTCRVFVSSPFGGIEREREELVARYFPQLAAQCQAKGVQFVAVDMRWGITTEASSNNQTVNICLREIDRSDIFVGIYAQRYGWHGAKDDSLQQNIDQCLKRYPWLKSVRDRSVTEFEFMLGHLNKPGSLPATFAFRSKEYDDQQLAEARKEKNEGRERKFVVESDVAKKNLASLVSRVVKTKAKCLAVHENYKTPEDAARMLFEDMKAHLETVLLKNTQAQSARDLELACHDAYMATRTTLYIGGQAYMKELDATLQKGGKGHLVVGPAGSGKGALVSNWLTNIRKKNSHAVIYNFVGCSKNSASVSGILQHVTEELELVAGEVKKKKSLEDLEEADAQPTELSDLFQKMEVALNKAAKKKKLVIVIDGLSRLEQLSRITKTLFWLPVDLPPKTVTIVVTCRDDSTDVIKELTERGYNITKMQSLTEQQQKEFCVGFLQYNSKELSASQLKAIVDPKQSENPLYLKTLLAELCSFGNFRQLDNKISTLVKSCNVAELFEQFLIRLEEDYNGTKDNEKNRVQQVMCGLTLAKKGLTETEIREMMHIPSAAWSPLYFAIKDFILDYSGLIRLSFPELREAVEKRYLSSKADRDRHLKLMIDYFQKQRKSFTTTHNVESVAVGRVANELTWLLRTLGDKEALVEVLTDVTIFARMFMEEEYELMELWRLTGRSAEQIVQLYLKAIDKRRHDFLNEANPEKKSSLHVIDMFVLSYLDALTYFLELNHFTDCAEGVLRQRLAILGKLSDTSINEDRRQRMISQVQVKLSYIYAGKGAFTEAKKMLEDALTFRIKVVENTNGQAAVMAMKDLAGCYHALGLLYSKSGEIDLSVEHYKKSMMLHEKLNSPVELADSMNNLGVMLMRQSEYSQAAELCTKALKIYEEIYFGHLPPIIGVMIGNIAVCLRNLKRLDESEVMYKKALDIAERALGKNHPNVATALTNLGTLEVNRDQYEKAEVYLKEAVSIHKACLSQPNNSDFFKTREKYVFTLIKLGKKKEAMQCFDQLYDQAVKTNMSTAPWPTVWSEACALLLAEGQAAKVSNIVMFIMKTVGPNEVMATFLDRADRASKSKEKRPVEFTVAYALEKNPSSQLLLAYQAQEVFIPQGKTGELLQLLDTADQAIQAGPDLFHAAVSWCQAKQKEDMAFEVMKHASDRFPKNVNFSSQVCAKLREKDKFQEALPYAQRMYSAQPNDVHVLLFVGEIFIQNADLTTAKEVFTKATRLAKSGSNEFKQASSGLEIVKMMEKRRASLSALK